MQTNLDVRGRFLRPYRLVLARLLAGFAWLFLITGDRVHAGNSTNVVERAERIYRAARAEYEAHPDQVQSACDFARSCFDRAELPQEDSARTALGREGMAAARRAVSKQPTNATAHYYLGMNMGEVARTKRMSGLKLVADMEEEFQIAHDLDEKLDYAGPDRCLGMLYRDAPGWPVSIGNRAKARQHLMRALVLSPDYPENWINMIETCLEWGEIARASKDAVLLKEIWSASKSKFSGEAWEASWDDWDERWEKIQKKLAEKAKPVKGK